MANEIVVKVGGSLCDLPDLGSRLRTWLDTLLTKRVLLVPGGGAAADMVRQADDSERLGEERSHWLALRALTFTAHLLAARLPGSVVIEELCERESAWRDGKTPILDMHAFALADESNPDHLPHLWSVTSDSLAARVAMLTGSSELVLLKSCSIPEPCDWIEASRRGIVDETFANLMSKAGHRMKTRVLNLRQERLASSAAPPPGRAL